MRVDLIYVGLKGLTARATLLTALSPRCWRIDHALAMRLVLRVTDHYASGWPGGGFNLAVHTMGSMAIDISASEMRHVDMLDIAPIEAGAFNQSLDQEIPRHRYTLLQTDLASLF